MKRSGLPKGLHEIDRFIAQRKFFTIMKRSSLAKVLMKSNPVVPLRCDKGSNCRLPVILDSMCLSREY